MPRRWLAFLFVGLFLIFFPLVALAQEAGAESFLGFDLVTLGVYLAIALALVELAKRVAVIIPGKRDDEIIGIIEAAVRKLVDFIAGRHGKTSDSSLVRKE